MSHERTIVSTTKLRGLIMDWLQIFNYLMLLF